MTLEQSEKIIELTRNDPLWAQWKELMVLSSTDEERLDLTVYLALAVQAKFELA